MITITHLYGNRREVTKATLDTAVRTLLGRKGIYRRNLTQPGFRDADGTATTYGTIGHVDRLGNYHPAMVVRVVTKGTR